MNQEMERIRFAVPDKFKKTGSSPVAKPLQLPNELYLDEIIKDETFNLNSEE